MSSCAAAFPRRPGLTWEVCYSDMTFSFKLEYYKTCMDVRSRTSVATYDFTIVSVSTCHMAAQPLQLHGAVVRATKGESPTCYGHMAYATVVFSIVVALHAACSMEIAAPSIRCFLQSHCDTPLQGRAPAKQLLDDSGPENGCNRCAALKSTDISQSALLRHCKNMVEPYNCHNSDLAGK